MSIITTDPFDIKTQEEFEALTNVVCGKIKYLLQRKFLTSKPGTTATPAMMRDYLYKILFDTKTRSSNKLDVALALMGIDDDIDEEIVDCVCFIREFMLRYVREGIAETTIDILRRTMR